jgi:hypothetical protein
MKTFGGVDAQTHIFLTLALLGGECSTAHPRCIISMEEVPSTHWRGGWVDSRAGLDDGVKKNGLTYQHMNRDTGREHDRFIK